MKKKIVGIFIMTLLIATTVLSVAGNTKIRCIIGKQTENNSNIFDMNYLDDQTQINYYNINLGKFRGRAYNDFITKVQQTSDGGYIAIGATESYGAGDLDVWLIKTDSYGNELWNKTYGGSGRDAASGGQQTSDGGYILVGIRDDNNLYLVKTLSNGNVDWSKTFGISGPWDCGYFIQQTSDGGYIITGTTSSYGAGDYDLWLIKTDSNGDEDWNKTFGGAEADGGFLVREIIDEGYIIIGWTNSFSPNPNYHDAWLIKTDENGNEIWNQTHGCPDSSDAGHDVQQTDDGGYIIIGYTHCYGDNDHEFYLIKTDENGNEEWNNTFPGADAQTIFSLVGYCSGMAVRLAGDGYILTGITDAEFGNGQLDILVIETDENGEELWNKTYGGTSIDEGYWMDETSDGGYILCGATSSYGTGTLDGWLIKTDSNGNEDWNKTIPAVPNTPPNAPTIKGPNRGKPGKPYDFTFNAVDLDNDQVKYIIDWGDGKNETTTMNPSGTDVKVSHSWDNSGTCIIKAKAQDSNGSIGPESTKTVKIPRTRAITWNFIIMKILERFPLLERMLNFQ